MTEPAQPELPPDPIALEQFLKDVPAITALREYLATESGRKFRGVLAAMDPMRGLCEVRTLKPDSVRVLAKVEETSAPSILAFCRGYGTAVSIIETLRRPPPPKPEAQTRKGGRGIAPHPSPNA